MKDFKLAEKRRIEAVHQFLQIDFDKSKEYQEIVDLAAELCEKPVALLSLLDKDVNWLKVRSGVSIQIMPKETSFCQYVVQSESLMVIDDVTKDSRFDDNPLVYTEPKVRFYAGAPLLLSSGITIGSLCLFDLKPNTLTPLQQKTLAVLSSQITNLMELDLSHKLLKLKVEEIEERNKSLQKIAFIQSHEIRHPLTTIMGLVNLVRYNYQEVDEEWIQMIVEATNNLDNKILSIVNETIENKDIRTNRFYKMVEEIEDYAIILLDKEGNIENWNKGAEKIKGYKPIEIIGKNFSVFYTSEDLEIQRPQKLINLATEKGFAKDEGWRVKKDGSRFWGSILITAIHNQEGEVIGFTKVTRDLSEKKEREEVNMAYIAYLEDQVKKLSA
ncbi:PAS domain S-box protein [Emticicia sp. BO119]|uniref:PAS domain S-box protein n=1 Tax=Emticicia sp. BO119 TaxID=2757768 RepID=UPI0015F07130|nr:PAS domain S-box protein [Emticicia sp. BO119]MBA4852020.1 PAS domain S-box protein [Emticicia sp. BO119]